MIEQKIPKKMLQTQMEEKLAREKSRTWIVQIIKDTDIRGGVENKYKKRGNARTESARDFSVRVKTYLRKDLKTTMKTGTPSYGSNVTLRIYVI